MPGHIPEPILGHSAESRVDRVLAVIAIACCAMLSHFSSAQSLSRVRLCDPMDCSTPGFPAHHQLPELTQIHVRWVSDAIQPSHPLSCPSPPAKNLSQHQGLFQ